MTRNDASGERREIEKVMTLNERHVKRDEMRNTQPNRRLLSYHYKTRGDTHPNTKTGRPTLYEQHFQDSAL